MTRYAVELRLPPDGQAALETLRTTGSSGDVVLSNSLTTGTIESFSGLEDPLEGRQPLIEDAEFLSGRISCCSRPTSGSSQPTDGHCSAGSGSDGSSSRTIRPILGTTATLGGGVGTVGGDRGLTRVWSAVGSRCSRCPSRYRECGDGQRPAGRQRRAERHRHRGRGRSRCPAGRALAASPPRRAGRAAALARPARAGGRPGGATLAEHADQPPAPRRTGLRHRARARGDRAAPPPRRRQPGPARPDPRHRARPLRRRARSPTWSVRSRTCSACRASRSAGSSPSSSSRSRSPTCSCSTPSGGRIAPTSGSAGSSGPCRPPSSSASRRRDAGRRARVHPRVRRGGEPAGGPRRDPGPGRRPADPRPRHRRRLARRDRGRRRGSQGAHVVSHPVNSGQGAALQTGYLVAERLGVEVVVTLDADGQHDPAEMERLVGPIVARRGGLRRRLAPDGARARATANRWLATRASPSTRGSSTCSAGRRSATSPTATGRSARAAWPRSPSPRTSSTTRSCCWARRGPACGSSTCRSRSGGGRPATRRRGPTCATGSGSCG